MASTKAYMQAYNKEYYLKNKERIKEQTKNYKKLTGYKYTLSEEQKEQSRDRAREWYENNKELMILRSKEWKKANTDKVNAGSRNYASRRRGAEGNYSVKDFLKLKNRNLGLCYYCGDSKANSIDHVIPLSLGGTNYIGNILPVCDKCNSSKGGKTLYKWRVRSGRVFSI